ncbi:MAG: DUF1653 domain-containing protein [Dokdonella sp.]|uniref:DUF1653 domain-containing protein n=1 Tax=Dokdonella sp. TaxID=2291710 RepID=UPI0032630740
MSDAASSSSQFRASSQRASGTDLPALPEVSAGRYRHYKGGDYEVIGVARHSESLEPVVLYRPLYNDSGLWIRPWAMFFEQVDHAGRLQPRFAWMGDAADAESDCVPDLADGTVSGRGVIP